MATAAKQIPDLKITLSNVKYSAFASEETSCFQASVVVNDVVVGTARNDGKGGMTFIEPQTLVDALNEYGAMLPKRKYSTMELDQNAESLVDDALVRVLQSKDLQKALRKRVLFTVKGKTGVYQTKTMTAEQLRLNLLEPNLKSLLGKDCDQILNLIDFDDALDLYLTSPTK